MKDGVISGAIPEGVAGMTTVSIVLILVVAMGNMLVKSGCMEAIVDWMNNTIIKTPRGCRSSYLGISNNFWYFDCSD